MIDNLYIIYYVNRVTLTSCIAGNMGLVFPHGQPFWHAHNDKYCIILEYSTASGDQPCQIKNI